MGKATGRVLVGHVVGVLMLHCQDTSARGEDWPYGHGRWPNVN